MTRVLVVEDEESYSDALSYMLRKEGFEVAIAATGPDALAEFDRAGADIVLLDLMLPGMPGTEVCRQIRQTSNVPVIMVSAKDDEVDKVVGLELGADDYVTKPYSPEGSSVVVSATGHEAAVDLSVTDRGIGIPAGELDRIFERFYRVDPARHRSTGGTGLGLSIVKHVAASHGGEVRVWSVEGQGSTFTLSLPRRATEAPPAGHLDVTPEIEGPARPDTSATRRPRPTHQEATP